MSPIKTLQQAIEAEDIGALTALLDAGHDPTVGDPNAGLPLNEAVGAPDMVRLLLSRGADARRADEHGRTPLHNATWRYQQESVDLLLNAGADINARDNAGWSPIFLGRRAAFEHLLARGADVLTPAHNGQTLLRRLVESHRTKHDDAIWLIHTLESLGVKLSAERPDDNGSTLLHEALLFRPTDQSRNRLAHLFLERGLDPVAKNSHGNTPLHLAAKSGDADMVEALLRHKADPNAKNNDGARPLALVKSYVSEAAKINKLLVEAGHSEDPPALLNTVTVSRGTAFVVVKFTHDRLSAALQEVASTVADFSKTVAEHPTIKSTSGRFAFRFEDENGQVVDEPAFFERAAHEPALSGVLEAYVEQVMAANRASGDTLYVHDELEAGVAALVALLKAKAPRGLDLLRQFVKTIDLDHTVALHEVMDFVRQDYPPQALLAIDAVLRDAGFDGVPPAPVDAEEHAQPKWVKAFAYARGQLEDDQKFRMMHVVGNRAWLNASGAGLFAFDVTTPRAPKLVVEGTDFAAYWTQPAGALAYEPYRQKTGTGLEVVALSDAPTMTQVPFDLPKLQTPFAVQPGLLVATVEKDGAGGIAVFDLAEHATPKLRGRLELAEVKGLALSGETLYAATATQLVVVDLSDPSAPKEVTRLESPLATAEFGARDLRELAVLGDVLIANNMWVLDCTDARQPRTIGINMVNADKRFTLRDGNSLITFTEHGRFVTIPLGDRAGPLHLIKGQLLEANQEESMVSVRSAALVDGVLLVMTASELLVYTTSPTRAAKPKAAAQKAKKPAAKKPAAKKPGAKKPAAKKPAAKKPAAKKPAAKKPAAKKPATKKPATKKPARKKPTAKKRAAKTPAAKKPGTRRR